MSLYTKSWLFVAWTLLVLLAFPYWLPFLEEVFGPFGLLVGAAFWLGHGVIARFCFTCPECDLSTFQTRRGGIPGYSPWPRKICSRCGYDHTRTD